MFTQNPFQITPWILAARPKTLTAGFVPVLAATALALADKGTIDWRLVLCALLTSFFIQIGTNLTNDALDFKKGADTADRLGPLRMTQSGMLSMQHVMAGGFICFAAASLFGLPLVYHGGLPLALALVLSLMFSYLYTGGPIPLSYYGLGDLFVMIFYGLVTTISVYYVLTGTVSSGIILAGTQIGLLATSILAMNNSRDIDEDRSARKLTLAVRFGINFARMEVTILLFLPFVMGILWLNERYWMASILPLGAFPVASFVVRGIWNNDPGRIYNKFFGATAMTHLFFGLLLSLSFLMS